MCVRGTYREPKFEYEITFVRCVESFWFVVFNQINVASSLSYQKHNDDCSFCFCTVNLHSVIMKLSSYSNSTNYNKLAILFNEKAIQTLWLPTKSIKFTFSLRKNNRIGCWKSKYTHEVVRRVNKWTGTSHFFSFTDFFFFIMRNVIAVAAVASSSYAHFAKCAVIRTPRRLCVTERNWKFTTMIEFGCVRFELRKRARIQSSKSCHLRPAMCLAPVLFYAETCLWLTQCARVHQNLMGTARHWRNLFASAALRFVQFNSFRFVRWVTVYTQTPHRCCRFSLQLNHMFDKRSACSFLRWYCTLVYAFDSFDLYYVTLHVSVCSTRAAGKRSSLTHSSIR